MIYPPLVKPRITRLFGSLEFFCYIGLLLFSVSSVSAQTRTSTLADDSRDEGIRDAQDEDFAVPVGFETPPEDEVESVMVTGSRIRSSSAVSAAPVLTITSEDALLSGRSDVVDVISQLPALANSINSAQTADQQGIEGDADGGSSLGVATLNLRSLGTKRTLVLVDGRRHVGGRAGDTAVNLNTIPVSLIDRVEVLTGGASAIYGADAVSGVVNIITKRDLDGFDVRAQVSTNDNGDGTSYLVAASAGSLFAEGKGNAMLGLEFRRQSNFTCGQAEFCRGFGVLSDGGNPAFVEDSDIKPRIYRDHNTFAISSADGRIGIDFDGDGFPDGTAPEGFFLDTNGDGINDVGQTPLGGEGFGDWVVNDGELRLFNSGEAGTGVNQWGGDGIASGPFDFQSIVPERDSLVANAIVRYEIFDGINFFSDTKVAYSQTEQVGQISAFNDTLTVTLDNPFIPAPLRSALDSAISSNPALSDTTTVYVTRDFLDLGTNLSQVESITFRTVNGFEGSFGKTLNFELSYNYGRTSEETIARNRRIEDRFFAAIDVVQDANNNPICRSELDPSAPPPPTSPFPAIEPGFRTFIPGSGVCQPLNLFGLGAPSQESVDFVTEDAVETSMIDQHVVHLNLTGDTSEFGFNGLPWAEPISFALGFEYRREASRYRPDGFSLTGLSFDGSITTGFDGSYDVAEGFGELSVPLFSDIPYAGTLIADGAMRYSDYSTVGSNISWKVGGSWLPLPGIRVRGGYSVAVRAPNVSELFQSSTGATFRPDDPCNADIISALDEPLQVIRRANCEIDGLPNDFEDPLTGRFNGVRTGNEDLNEEVARTYTLGVAGAPRMIPGLRFSLDYFNIELSDAIDNLPAQEIVNRCYNDANGLDNIYCQLFARNRDPDSPTYLGLNFLSLTQLNIAERAVSGIDFEASYTLNFSRISMPNLGVAMFRVFGTHLFRLVDIESGQRDNELNEIRRPDWIVNTGLRWQIDRLQLDHNLMFMSNQTLTEAEEINVYVNPYAGDTIIQNVSASYALFGETAVYGGVSNLTDEAPFGSSTSYPVSPIGRTFFIGINSSL